MNSRLTLIILLLLPVSLRAQSPFKGFENLFTPPKIYTVNYVKTPPVIDGDINDAVWQQAPWTDNFRDIEGDLKPEPKLQTNVKMLWGDTCLYIAAKIMDPHVWANIKQHDQIVFFDNDFEVFIDPNNTTHQYFELEFNALNTVFDLFLNKPYRNGGSAMFGWNAPGLKSAVKVLGTLNNAADVDKGWTIEMAIPYRAISIGNNIQTPAEGVTWRINFSRVEWDTNVIDGKYVKAKDSNGRNLPEHNWVWSPQGIINMHYPERWGYLLFNKAYTNADFVPSYAEQQKQYLWLAYYKQKKWADEHHNYIATLKDLDIGKVIYIASRINDVRMEATAHQFMVSIKDGYENTGWSINQDGLISEIN
ncbi:MAG: Carbohydrate family 9 binding domain-like [Mucilaginibacter sp.]|uniref:carbohydrate-binding family 9-like protein n=1 Tax=Mucilaginibacter sp. TaxID=1882438 RepID=UPI002602C4E0|nr:carbohydrate-binding family 9-like protein [Mucilaginibacter sp.]MDB5002445.1 Carbohydrate family 9 binding domain-like [Mucilaginibacter sp.]